MTGDQVLAILRPISRPAWLPLSYVMAHAQIESSFQEHAVATDGTGSEGLMQVEPTTARDMGGGNQFIPVVSLRTGICYIIWLHGYLSGRGLEVADYAATIAEAYNEGPGARVDGRRDPDYRHKWVAAQAQWEHVD